MNYKSVGLIGFDSPLESNCHLPLAPTAPSAARRRSAARLACQLNRELDSLRESVKHKINL